MSNKLKELNTFFRQESDLNNIAKGAKDTGIITLKNNVHAIHFFLTAAGVGATRAEIGTDVGSIIIRYQGKQIFEATGTQILDLFKHKFDSQGALTTAGVISVRFSRKDLPLAGQNGNYALGMLDMSLGKPMDEAPAAVLTYELNWLSPAALTIDAGSVFTEYDELPYRPIGAHVRTVTHNRSFTGTGNQDITDLPIKDVAGILAYHFVNGNVGKISVKRDNTDIYRDLPMAVHELAQREAGRTKQSGYSHVCFDLQNDIASVAPLAGVSNWLVQPNWTVSPAGSYTILAEQLHVGI
jgi:hypothetical protein